MEVFILYNKNTGFIKSSGRVDKEWDSEHIDDSTVAEYTKRKLTEDSALSVIYFPEQNLPDSETHKIENGQIVKK